ncbi:MAG: energy-coupling factor ABC transporter substrate-binding protein [Methanomicrobiales archaeon]|nr:energy-coupling factor ABC transporter substrate-binding protein [Methanomicrobiales archaeon]
MRFRLELIAFSAVALLALILFIQNAAVGIRNEGEEAWGGTDTAAASIIEGSGYTPWFEPLWEPPSGEIETLLFTLQAAAGSVVIGYFFGYYRGKKGA